MTSERIPIPIEWVPEVQRYIEGFPSDTREFSSPHIRRPLIHVYFLFIVLYTALGATGIIGNILMFSHIIHKGLFRQQSIFGYLLGLNICCLFMATAVLPLSLSVLLIHNWIFGSYLCYTIATFQDLPFYVSVLTLLFLCINRYTKAVKPNENNSNRLPPLRTTLAIWIASFVLVSPYAFYMKYLDLEPYLGKPFQGVGICSVLIEGNFEFYIKSLFFFLYVLPLVLTAIFHTKTRRVLEKRTNEHQNDKVWATEESGGMASVSSKRDSDTNISVPVPNSIRRTSRMSSDAPFQSSSPYCEGRRGSFGRTFRAVNLKDETKSQRYLGFVTLTSGLTLFPLTALRFVKNFYVETEWNSFIFDVTYISFVWIAFLPVAIVPLLYFAWKSGRKTKERIGGLFCITRGNSEEVPRRSQDTTQQLFSSSDRAAHRLSLEPVMIPPRHARLSVPDARLFGPQIWTPILVRSEKQFQRPRIHSFNY